MALFTFVFAVVSPAFGCPLCFGSTPYELGLYWSVLFLLPVPFVIVGVLIAWIRRQSDGNIKEG